MSKPLESVATIIDLVTALEKRYPNNVFIMKQDKNEDMYLAKLELIEEIKKLGGITNGTDKAK